MANQLLQEDSFRILLEDGGVLLIDGGAFRPAFSSDAAITRDVALRASIPQDFESSAPVTQSISSRVVTS